MDALLGYLGTLFDLALVLVGFTLIIVIHELGHFLTARWAGIRVHAFAVGFGPALVSWRRGLGLRRGSSEPEYLALQDSSTADRERKPSRAAGVSPTEYRFNAIPFGGYVKMLGQDDADPGARSEAADSYQSAPVWKRMIVISAGVILNLVTAAILFVVVFTLGLETEPARVGEVRTDSPAATAVALNASELGVTTPGLQPGDRIVSINGQAPDSFKDVALTAAMTAKNQPIDLTVERPGVAEPLRFAIVPRINDLTRMLDIGIGPAASGKLVGSRFTARESADFKRMLKDRGLPELEPGSVLVSVGGQPAESFYDLSRAIARSGSQAVLATFRSPAGVEQTVSLTPTAELPTKLYDTPLGRIAVTELLGLSPVMAVSNVVPESGGEKAGLQSGDIFAQLGDLEWPNVPEGILEINRGQRVTVPITVARPGAETGSWVLDDRGPVKVTRGRVGFGFTTSAEVSTMVARHPTLVSSVVMDDGAAGAPAGPAGEPSGAALRLAPGSRILSVDGRAVDDFAELRNELQASVRGQAGTAGSEGTARVTLRVRPPLRDEAAAIAAEREVVWLIPGAEVRELLALGWSSPLPPTIFALEKTVLKGESPVASVSLGVRETNRVMVSTYLTFARLFQGTVRVEHLKGPVGIAHVGTQIAERGFIWLLFFMAVISVNLAVINFLPLPIVDGGQFLFLVWEQVTGRMVSVLVQNLATLAGLALIGSMFLIVTFNDLANLLWR
jgi:regulator of sigma E protease